MSSIVIKLSSLVLLKSNFRTQGHQLVMHESPFTSESDTTFNEVNWNWNKYSCEYNKRACIQEKRENHKKTERESEWKKLKFQGV